jgi:SAM-dependent methyltransferase
MATPDLQAWDNRFAQDAYIFGTSPNAFLVRSVGQLPKGGRVLAVADGEGRNGVWLAQQGFAVHAIDGSKVAVAKSMALAKERGVTIVHSIGELTPGSIFHECVDTDNWVWPTQAFDAVVGIFIQFTKPAARESMFGKMIQALKTGGVLLLEGYHLRQPEYGTGGPAALDQLYDVDLLATAFESLERLELREYDQEVDEGDGHRGLSALVDFIGRARIS